MSVLRKFNGPYGSALELEIPDTPESAATVQHWLITAPRYHPAWSQYSFAVLRLAEMPGFPPPKLQFPGATHEVCIVALDPGQGDQTAETMMEYALPGPKHGKLPWLSPPNIAAQAIASDEEMAMIAPYLVRAVTHKGITPETGDAPERVRKTWAGMVSAALDHVRGLHD